MTAVEQCAEVLGQQTICGLQCTAVRLPAVQKVLVVMIDEEGLDSSIVIEDRYDAYPWPKWDKRFEVISAAAKHRAALFSLMAGGR